MQTRINRDKYTFGVIKSLELEHLNNLKTGRVPYSGLELNWLLLTCMVTDHACQQKPNPSRETVPLKGQCNEIYIFLRSKHFNRYFLCML
jgi:hypothetical protein